jgi:hypothetical protein
LALGMMERVTKQILDVVIPALEHDYQKHFRNDLEIAAQVRKKKIPTKAVEELRNGFDHFAKSLVSAVKADARGAGKRSRSLAQIATLNAWRGKRHIVTGQYHCIFYTAFWRDEQISAALDTALDANPKIDALQKELKVIEEDWEKIETPSKRRYPTLGKIKAEIERTQNLNKDLNAIAERLDKLLLEIPKLGRSVVFLNLEKKKKKKVHM